MISKSSGKITKVSNADDVEIKYGHIIQVLTDWIDTTILVSVDGRGTAKSTVIQARRSARCVEEMPGGAFAFVANTYSNLEDNIMPAVQKGWQLMGLIEGVHYVKDTRPPESWRRKCSLYSWFWKKERNWSAISRNQPGGISKKFLCTR